MTTRIVTFTAYDGTDPLAGLVPVFLQYRRLDTKASTAQPPIVEVGGGQYAFTLSEADTYTGVSYVIDMGAAVPRYEADEALPTAIEVATATPPGSGVQTFGVTNVLVQVDYFSQGGSFSDISNPSSASVDRYINQQAARLESALLKESIDASDVTALGSTSAPYLWCQDTLELMVAMRVAKDMLQSPPPNQKDWKTELDERLKDLDENGYLALGGGLTAPAEQPDGPTHFIDELGLDTSVNNAAASSVDAPFHKDDLL